MAIGDRVAAPHAAAGIVLMDNAALLELLFDTFDAARFTPSDVIDRLGGAGIPIVIDAMGGPSAGPGARHRAICVLGLQLSALSGRAGVVFDAGGRARYVRTAARLPKTRASNRHGDWQIDAAGVVGQKRSYIVRQVASVDAAAAAARARVQVPAGVDLDAFAVELDRRVAQLESDGAELRALIDVLAGRLAQSRRR